MTTDEKVKLARRIEEKLVGITASEWSKWRAYAQREGLKKALHFAQVIQNSPSLRPGPKQSYRTIARVVAMFQKQLESLSSADVAEILGYTGRWIVARRIAKNEGRNRR